MMLYTMGDDALKIHHADGVFSCFTIRLEAILDYYNTFKRPPALIDSSQQFAKWKEMHHGDISDAFFRHDDSVSIPEYGHLIKATSETDEQQFSDYSKLNLLTYDLLWQSFLHHLLGYPKDFRVSIRNFRHFQRIFAEYCTEALVKS